MARSVCFSSEDDRDESNIRLSEMAKAEGAVLAAMTELHIIDIDAICAAENARKGRIRKTIILEEIRHVLARPRPVLLVLDSLADVLECLTEPPGGGLARNLLSRPGAERSLCGA